MYVYLSPQGGFNDMLSNIQNTIDYCIKTKRTLLIDTTKSCYRMNFFDYFYFKNLPINIETDVNVIRKIISDESLTIYPKTITNRNLDTWKFIWTRSGIYTLFGTQAALPYGECNDDLIIHSKCGGGRGIVLFRNLFFRQTIIDHVKHEFAKLVPKYVVIQIRNTDIKCDYVSLYKANKDLISGYDAVYIATDDPGSLEFFRAEGLNVLNFTEFPDNPTFNLHYSKVSCDTKIKNLICDMYIISMADKLVSNSYGGFINLLRDIREDVSIITNKFV
jgi:hypothetical protein